jgi:hypothetical protein
MLNVRIRDNVKGSIYEELGHISDQFPWYVTKILLGDFYTKIGRADTIKKNTEALLDAIKKVGLEVNQEKTKYMLMSHSQKIG